MTHSDPRRPPAVFSSAKESLIGRTGPEDLHRSVATFDRVEEGATAIATLSTKNHEVFESRVRDRSHVCLACGQPSVHRFLYRKNGCDILRCEQCGLGRAETMGFDPKSYYTSDYFSGERPDGYADYIGTENILRREFAGTVEFIRKFRASGRLLDVGCAYGFFLHEAKRFFDVSGIELAEDAAEHCRRSGLNVFTGQADETLLGRLGTTDVIVLLDVIEHLPSPRDTIALLVNHLDPGGIIVITTGDFVAVFKSCRGTLAADDTAAAPMVLFAGEHAGHGDLTRSRSRTSRPSMESCAIVANQFSAHTHVWP